MNVPIKREKANNNNNGRTNKHKRFGNNNRARRFEAWQTTPPKPGEPQTKTVPGKSKLFHWCAECNRWSTTHGTAEHTGPKKDQNKHQAQLSHAGRIPPPGTYLLLCNQPGLYWRKNFLHLAFPLIVVLLALVPLPFSFPAAEPFRSVVECGLLVAFHSRGFPLDRTPHCDLVDEKH